MKYLLGFIMGLILASSMSIAQEWIEPSNPQVLIPMPPIYMPTYPPPSNYSLPPMAQPSWEHVSPC